MAILHVKSPNGTQKDINLDKILLTEGDQVLDSTAQYISDSTIGESYGVTFFGDHSAQDLKIFGDYPGMAYRDLNHTCTKTHNSQIIGFRQPFSDGDGAPGANIRLIGESDLDDNEGRVRVYASNGSALKALEVNAFFKEVYWDGNPLIYKSGTGWLSWGDKMGMCWGDAKGSTSEDGVSIEFPIYFNGVPSVVCGIRGGSADSRLLYCARPFNIDQYGFTLITTRRYNNTNTIGAYTCSWIAFGPIYWLPI